MATHLPGRPALPATVSGPRPGDFPPCSLESRAAARAMLDAKQEEGGVDLHVEVVGYGPDPECDCRDCRRWWSKFTAEDRAAAVLKFEKEMRLAGYRTVGVSEQAAVPEHRQEQQGRQEQQAVDAADRHTRVNGANALGYLAGQGYASSTDETARRRFPQTRTGAAMAFLRGGGSR